MPQTIRVLSCCHICEKHLSRSQHLKAHYRIAHQITLGTTTFRRVSNERYTYVQGSKEAESTQFGCVLCIRHFESMAQLKTHCQLDHKIFSSQLESLYHTPKRKTDNPDVDDVNILAALKSSQTRYNSPDAIAIVNQTLYDLIPNYTVNEDPNPFLTPEPLLAESIVLGSENIGPQPRVDSRWIVDGVDVSSKFHLFKKRSLALGNQKPGLFLETNVEEILSQSHILLLKPKQHCELALEIFGGADFLSKMYMEATGLLVESNKEFDNQVAFKLQCLISDLQCGKATRQATLAELHKIMENSNENTYAVLRAISNLILELPRTTLLESVGEIELCVTYIDSVLKPLISNPDREVLLRWPNKQAPESKMRKETRAKQPDALISHIQQLNYDYSLGHGEVKIEQYANDKFGLAVDLIKLATFNKDAIDERSLNSCFAFQVVGHHITVYITKLLADGLYAMTEMAAFNVPKSIQELDSFVTITNMRKLMMITTSFWDNCKLSSNAIFFDKNRRPTLNTPEYKAIMNSSRDRRRPSTLVF